MQTTHRHLTEIMSPKGLVSATAMPDLRALVERYPYFHLARLTLLRLLYQQRDPEFNDELRRAALYLPSRETIFNFVEAERMRPRVEEEKESPFGGAILSRKPNERLGSVQADGEEHRTESLIDSFLNSIPSMDGTAAERPFVPQRRGRADATVDYISYMLEEEAEMSTLAPATPAATSQTDADVPVTTEGNEEEPVANESPVTVDAVVPGSEVTADNNGVEDTVTTPVASNGTSELIDQFIQKQGDRRIKLKDKSDSDLQKPVLEVENTQQKGAFTETLARIYIKQGKFEHAIEIIRRLSLKYPKKNRYFADQIRFLEKIIANNQASKG